MSDTTSPPQDFAATVEQLETIEGRLNVTPFTGPDDPKDAAEDESKETPPW